MKLELKHLAPYLPYGLKVFRDTGETSEILELSSGKIMLWQDGYYESFKPILRPLSDLTKRIDDNENNLTYSAYLKLWTNEDLDYCQSNPLGMCYENIVQLLEWHFDIFGLIESGQAIDINTLNK